MLQCEAELDDGWLPPSKGVDKRPWYKPFGNYILLVVSLRVYQHRLSTYNSFTPHPEVMTALLRQAENVLHLEDCLLIPSILHAKRSATMTICRERVQEKRARGGRTHLHEIIADLHAWLAFDGGELDDHIQSLRLLLSSCRSLRKVVRKERSDSERG